MSQMYVQKICQIRDALSAAGAAGVLLSTQDNIFYASGFSSVMDGWHLVEPIAALFIPTDMALPVVLILPEASIISLIVSARGGHPVHLRGDRDLRYAELLRNGARRRRAPRAP